MKKSVCISLLLLLFFSSLKAQNGFRIEAGIGPTVGDQTEYFSYGIQGNLYYLWSVSETVAIGPTAGVFIFLGEGNYDEDSSCLFCSVPEWYFPIAIATRINLTKMFSLGADVGYGINPDVFADEGGFYARPIITYNLKKKLALIASYGGVWENGSNALLINFGINIGI